MVRRGQLRPTLSVRLSQRLAMTPSLLQKIELLTLSRLELSELLNQELAENPVLEEVQESSDFDAPEKPAEQQKAEQEQGDTYDDFDYEYFFGEYLGSSYRNRERESGDDDRPSFDLFLASPSTLSDHLTWQLNLSDVSSSIRPIADFIIGNINADGYLTVTTDEIASSLSVPLSQVQAALALVQSLDPTGVGARDLQECLLLQLRAADLAGSLEEKLVQSYLPLIQQKKFKEISKELGCEYEDITRALENIRRFSPKPGQKYSSEKPVYVQPDVYIYKLQDEYQIGLNDDGLPRLKLNRAYREMLKEQNVSKDTKSFIKERFRSALELLKSVDQRQQTIFRVCQCIVNRQRDFLDRGLLYLRPMLIKDVAEELGVHSSTISRVVANKYAHTPQGVIELRKFFTVGVESADGENLSIVHVKERIKRIIGNENSAKPLSDQKIARILNQEGIQITRRTVAKYRDQMHVPGSRERKMAVPY
ncbi:MAG: RNA polymerase sigma-54 factor [Acidobacteria bacterium]|nr:MAG: RNA polymerase sigma-54 factor [Acidobacteriota bacterium]